MPQASHRSKELLETWANHKNKKDRPTCRRYSVSQQSSFLCTNFYQGIICLKLCFPMEVVGYIRLALEDFSNNVTHIFYFFL
jgi:hypothetical protein